MSNPVVRRARRSEAGPVLRLTFPAGTLEADVATALAAYGLDGYTVAEAEGVFTATRSDLKSISPDTTMQIKLSDDGLMATVTRQATPKANPEDKDGITISSLEFAADKFTSDTIQAWLTEKGVDGEIKEPQNPEEGYVVRRSDVQDNQETRRMTLDEGVTAVVTRSDAMGIPPGFVAVVSEAAYGCWGWGQLDFAASMADTEFSEQMREALNTLDSVLRNIVLWSSLPLDTRKDLANRALAQFGAYIGTVMDSLPRQLLVSVVRSSNHQPENTMTTEKTTAPAQEAPADDTTPLTRADVAALIEAGVVAALLARSEPAPAGTAAPTETAAPAAAAIAEEDKQLTRADFKALVEEVVKPLNDAVEQLKGITVVRSAPEQVPAAEEKVKDVFRGSFPGLRAGTSK